MATILIIDDDKGFVSAATTLLSADGHDVDSAGTVDEAQRKLSSGRFDLMFVDLSLPDGSGLELIGKRSPRAVIITGHPSVETAVRAVRGDVVDYLVKPLDHDQLRAAAKLAAKSEDTTKSGGAEARGTAAILGDSPAIEKLKKTIVDYSKSKATVLIMGESGTGKELVARALHEVRDGDSKFVAVNCGAIPHELIASELFGHEKGAFTGATARRAGVFEQAGNGTVFLDEIGELPMDQQVALLRVLETRQVTRVGSSDAKPSNARVVAATNRNLEERVRDGEFREDLYFRLMVLPIEIPPLRERLGDVGILAEHFLGQYAEEYGSPRTISDDALQQLSTHSWPGNVRELKHVLLRAALRNIDNDEITTLPDGFENPPQLHQNAVELQPGVSIRDVEKVLITKTLEHFDGNRRLTAEALGVSLKTLYNRLREYSAADSSGSD